MHLLIIGGSDAGISAALRAHELNSSVEVTLALADDYFSICGLPYYLSGETPDWRDLAHRTEFSGVNVLRGHAANRSIAQTRKSTSRNETGERTFRYDRLIIATGASPIRPAVPGSALEGVFVLHTMDDSFAVQRWLAEREVKSGVLVGAG